MSINFFDIARMYSETTGDSDIELSTAVPGCKTFSQAGVTDSMEINYGIITYSLTTRRPVGSEVGVGSVTYDSDNVATLHRTTVLSSVLDGDSDLDANIDLTGLSEVYIPFLSKDILRVKESDGSPNVYPVNTIVVTNGSLTADSTEGQITLTVGGEGGGSSYAVYQNDVLPADSDALASSTEADPLFLTREVFDPDGLFTLSSHVLTCGMQGIYNMEIQINIAATGGLFSRGNVQFYVQSNSSETYPSWYPYYVFPVDSDPTISEIAGSFEGPISLDVGDTVNVAAFNATPSTLHPSIVTIVMTRMGDKP